MTAYLYEVSDKSTELGSEQIPVNFVKHEGKNMKKPHHKDYSVTSVQHETVDDILVR